MGKIFTVFCFALPISVWSTYWALGSRLSSWIAEKWGTRIVAAGDGKFTDAAPFIHARLFESAWLLTSAILLLLGVIYLGRNLARRSTKLWRWVAYAIPGFIGLNLWIKVAAGTVLFWCLFWNGKGTTDSLTQFNMKLLLMKENSAPIQVALAGSSQIHAQVDHRLLNEQLGPGFNTTDLGYPGNRACDFLWLNRQLEGSRTSVIVCYVSEGIFFNDGLSIGVPAFLSLRDMPEFTRLGWRLEWDPKPIWYTVLNNLVPVMRLRDSTAQRLLGDGLNRLPQRRRDSSLTVDLGERAKVAAPLYRADDQTRFQMASFEAFVAACQARHQRVVICCGQSNPLLDNVLSPDLRPKMREFLYQLATKYDHIILLAEDSLPIQKESDYEDLTHVNREAQIRFTQFIAAQLRKITAPHGSALDGTSDIHVSRTR